MKPAVCAGIVTVLFWTSGCSLFSSESWRENGEWRYEPPKTGSNVGRWIPVGEPSKPKRKTAKKVRREKAQEPRDNTPAPPPDRFR